MPDIKGGNDNTRLRGSARPADNQRKKNGNNPQYDSALKSVPRIPPFRIAFPVYHALKLLQRTHSRKNSYYIGFVFRNF